LRFTEGTTRRTVLESDEIVAVALWLLVTGTGPVESNWRLLKRTGNDTLEGRRPLLPSNAGPPDVAIWGCNGETPKDPGAGIGPTKDVLFGLVPPPDPPVLEPLVTDATDDAPLVAPGLLVAGVIPPPPPQAAIRIAGNMGTIRSTERHDLPILPALHAAVSTQTSK
jgi:hypothetical protein